MLYCHNPACQAPNSESTQFCHNCGTPLIRRYLWAISDSSLPFQPGDMLADRYLCKTSQIFLDTQPGLYATNQAEVPQAFLPYLRLSPWQLHVPQVYDWLEVAQSNATILLLDQAPLKIAVPGQDAAHSSAHVDLLPVLSQVWPQATAFSQLQWLWQQAMLWQPLSSEKVASTLLSADFLRVEGSLLKVLQLQGDRASLTLADLGHFWQTWIETAKPEIANFLQQLCQQLIDGEIYNAEILIDYLDRAIARLGQTQTYHIQTATLTDQGPTRQRNEDSCYPPSGTVQTLLPAQDPLVVVCDGIGGHQGGDVASGLAIQAVEQQIKSLDLTSPDATTLMVELEKAICLANDQISRRNDSEQRYERQRMGTTLVMGLLRGHELYITHVGDSRAYWITRQGCHQVTLDDDVASREVRLGYCTYQQALQHPGSGSLVQALGMGESSMLYPAVQRFILAEDSVFLLCSDGLSDGDRVEENWEAEILPLLEGKTDIESLSKRLVEIANTQNGHDNVTVGLIYVQMESAPASAANLSTLPSLATQQPTAAVRLSPAAPGTTASTPASATAFPTQISNAAATTLSERTELMQPKQDTSRARFILFGLIALLGGVIGLLAYFLLSPRLGAPEATPSLSPSPVGVSPGTDSSSPPALLAIGSIVQVVPQSAPVTPSVNPSPTQSPNVNSTIDSTVNSTIVAPTLRLQRSLPTATPSPSLVVPSPEDDAIAVANGTLLRVMTHQERDRIRWVQLQVCQPLPETRSIPQDLTQNPVVTSPLTPDVTPDAAATPFNAPSVVPQTVGQVGWIQESTLQTQVVPATALTPEQRAACQNPRQSRLPGEG